MIGTLSSQTSSTNPEVSERQWQFSFSYKSSVPCFLAWSTITETNMVVVNTCTKYNAIEKLRSNHVRRIETDPGYAVAPVYSIMSQLCVTFENGIRISIILIFPIVFFIQKCCSFSWSSRSGTWWTIDSQADNTGGEWPRHVQRIIRLFCFRSVWWLLNKESRNGHTAWFVMSTYSGDFLTVSNFT